MRDEDLKDLKLRIGEATAILLEVTRRLGQLSIPYEHKHPSPGLDFAERRDDVRATTKL